MKTFRKNPKKREEMLLVELDDDGAIEIRTYEIVYSYSPDGELSDRRVDNVNSVTIDIAMVEHVISELVRLKKHYDEGTDDDEDENPIDDELIND